MPVSSGVMKSSLVSLGQAEVQRFTLILVSLFHLKEANQNRFIQTILVFVLYGLFYA